jgi:tetratricopeptide (TPR) repeat protein
LAQSVLPPTAGESVSDATLQFMERRAADDPDDSGAQNRLALAYLDRARNIGDLRFIDRAAHAARASLAALPAERNVGAVITLATAEFESHHFKEALGLAQQAQAIDRTNRPALAMIGDAQLELGDYRGAEQAFKRLLAAEDSVATQARMARLAEFKGNTKQAIAILQKNLSAPRLTAKNQLWHRMRLAEIYFRHGNFTETEAQLTAAAVLAPDNFLVQEHIAELHGAQGRYDEAVQAYLKLVAKIPRGEFFHALGDLYVHMGRTAEAQPYYDRALSLYLQSVELGNAHYFHHLASFYSDARPDPVAAVRWARRDLEIRQSVYAYDSLGWALYKNGDYAAAAEAASKAVAQGVEDPHVIYHAGLVLSRAGKLADGGALLKKALAVNPHYNSFHVHR